MQRCQRLQILLLGPAPGPGPDPDPTPDHTLGAAPAQDPENVAIGKSNDFTCPVLTCILCFLCVFVLWTLNTSRMLWTVNVEQPEGTAWLTSLQGVCPLLNSLKCYNNYSN